MYIRIQNKTNNMQKKELAILVITYNKDIEDNKRKNNNTGFMF